MFSRPRVLSLTVSLLLAIVLLTVSWWNAGGGSDVVMTQADLQKRIDAKMPFTAKHDVVVSKVLLDLSNDSINIDMTASATKFHALYTVDARAAGTLIYESACGCFYFRPSSVQIVDIQKNDDSLKDKASGLFNRYVKSQALQARKEALFERADGIMQRSAEFAAETTLKRIPVYTLPVNFKGGVARIMLQSVEVKNGAIIAHLSFLQLTATVVLCLGVCAVLLLIVSMLASGVGGVAFVPF